MWQNCGKCFNLWRDSKLCIFFFLICRSIGLHCLVTVRTVYSKAKILRWETNHSVFTKSVVGDLFWYFIKRIINFWTKEECFFHIFLLNSWHPDKLYGVLGFIFHSNIYSKIDDANMENSAFSYTTNQINISHLIYSMNILNPVDCKNP